MDRQYIKAGELKVGDRVDGSYTETDGTHNTFTGTVVRINSSHSGVVNIATSSPKEMYASWGVDVASDGYFHSNNQKGELLERLVVKVNGKVAGKKVLTVRGVAPQVIIKIGCKEFNYSTAEKEALKFKRVLEVIKINDLDGLTVTHKEAGQEVLTLKDINDFLAWFKSFKAGLKK